MFLVRSKLIDHKTIHFILSDLIRGSSPAGGMDAITPVPRVKPVEVDPVESGNRTKQKSAPGGKGAGSPCR